MTPRLRRFWPFFAILAVAVFYCRDWFFAGRALLPVSGDMIYSYYSSFVYFKTWIDQGVWPFWNSLSICGVPYGLGLVGLFDLYRLSMIFFSVETGCSLVIFSGIALDGMFFHTFARRRGASASAAFAGALVWMFATVTRGTGVENETGFFALPLCLLLADRFLEQRSRARFAALTAALLFYLLNANPQYFMYGAALVFCWLLRGERARGSRFLEAASRAALPFVLAGGLSAFHNFRLLEAAAESNRATWTQIQVLFPTHWPLVFFPRLFESLKHPESGFIIERILQGLFSSAGPFSRVEGFLPPLYLGLLPIFCATAAFFCARRPAAGSVRFFLWAWALPLLYLVFHPFLYLALVRHLPILNGFTNVARVYHVHAFAAAMLTALLVDALLRRAPEATAAFKKAAVTLGGLALSVATGLFVVRAVLARFGPAIGERVASSLHAEGHAFIADAEAFRVGRVKEFFDYFADVTSSFNPHVILPLGAFAALAALVFFAASGKIGRRTTAVLLALWAGIDLGLWSGFAQSSSSAAERHAGVDMTRTFAVDATDIYRVLMVEDPATPFARMFLRPARQVTYGIAMPHGYEGLYPRRYVRFFSMLTRREKDAGFILHPTRDFEPALADFLNCKYVVTSAVNGLLEGNLDFKLVDAGKDWHVYLNANAMPRAFMAHESRVLRDAEAVEKEIRRRPEDLKRVVFFEEGGGGEALAVVRSAPIPERVTIVRHEPNRVEADVLAAAAGYLVLTENYYPGWKVRVDGEPAPVLRADYTFRAVKLEAGQHRVSFFYDPPSVKKGLFVTALFLAGLGMILISGRLAGLSSTKGPPLP